MDDRILEEKKDLPPVVFIDVGVNGAHTWSKVMRSTSGCVSFTKAGKAARKDCYEEAFGKTSRYAISDLFWAVFTRIDTTFLDETSHWEYTLVAHSENYTGGYHA